MASTAVKPRSLLGKLLLVAGIGLLALWAYYFVSLARPTDVWDLSPPPVALALIVVGVRFAGLGELILAQGGVSYKRDLVLALALGTLAELSLWAFLYFVVDGDPETAERWIALERLQEPGVKMGLTLFRYSYSHLGVRLDPYAVSVGVLLIQAAIWSSAAFALLRIARFFSTRHSTNLPRRPEPAR
jgi:hypothetical protein